MYFFVLQFTPRTDHSTKFPLLSSLVYPLVSVDQLSIGFKGVDEISRGNFKNILIFCTWEFVYFFYVLTQSRHLKLGCFVKITAKIRCHL